jgi:hypothetical protein|nr:MAG TPA: RNA polymerase II-associated protein 3 [Herelleviridae sp.]
MFEYFKKGFGLAVGALFGYSLTEAICSRILKALKQHESSEEEEDA